MTMPVGDRIAAAARGLIGTPFRLHGRSGVTGVDCVGLALLSARAAGLSVAEPPAYRLRAGDAPVMHGWMRGAGFAAVTDRAPGDILLVRVSALQPHIVIDAPDGVIHAHAGLGRVVAMPMPGDWSELSRWRFHGVKG